MTITKQTFTVLSALAAYYNKRLFDNKLPDCLVSLTRSDRFHGYYAPSRWRKKGDVIPIGLVDEIVLNANSLSREDRLWHSTLVHELVHQYEFHFGERSHGGYHNKAFARHMKSIGLQASHNGRPGGKDTGYRMTHYIIEGGPFERAFNAISKKDIAKYRLPLDSLLTLTEVKPALGLPGINPSDTTSGKRTKYTCGCGINIWSKPGISATCNTCKTQFKKALKIL